MTLVAQARCPKALGVGVVAQADQQHLGQLGAGHVAVGAEPAAAHAGDDALGHAGLNVALPAQAALVLRTSLKGVELVLTLGSLPPFRATQIILVISTA